MVGMLIAAAAGGGVREESLLSSVWEMSPPAAAIRYFKAYRLIESSWFTAILAPDLANSLWHHRTSVVSTGLGLALTYPGCSGGWMKFVPALVGQLSAPPVGRQIMGQPAASPLMHMIDQSLNTRRQGERPPPPPPQYHLPHHHHSSLRELVPAPYPPSQTRSRSRIRFIDRLTPSPVKWSTQQVPEHLVSLASRTKQPFIPHDYGYPLGDNPIQRALVF